MCFTEGEKDFSLGHIELGVSSGVLANVQLGNERART